MTFEKSLSKMGIHTDGVGTTDIAGFGVTQPLSEGMGQLFQLAINKGYQEFIQLVATNRNMTLAQVDSIAQGRVWSGKKAKELGLVDELGNLTDAVVAAAELANLDQYETLLIEKEQSSRNKFIKQMLGGSASLFTPFIGNQNRNLGDLTSYNVSDEQGVGALLTMLKNELTHMSQLNDPQGKYTLCLACSSF
jgi:protease-4